MSYLPFGLLLWLALLAFGALGRRSRWAHPALLAGVGGIFLWAWPPFSNLLAWSLERQVARAPLPAAAQAIVVLSANIYPRDRSQPETLPGFGTYLRCHYAAWLYRTWQQIPVLATGGPAKTPEGPVAIAGVMAQALAEDGVPRSMIWTEGASHSTYENALFSARILRQRGIHRIVLVTEAYHMPRALACFRRQGLEVAPAPFDYRTDRASAEWSTWLPSTVSILDNDAILHEWFGLVWYRISGRD